MVLDPMANKAHEHHEESRYDEPIETEDTRGFDVDSVNDAGFEDFRPDTRETDRARENEDQAVKKPNRRERQSTYPLHFTDLRIDCPCRKILLAEISHIDPPATSMMLLRDMPETRCRSVFDAGPVALVLLRFLRECSFRGDDYKILSNPQQFIRNFH